MVAQPKSAINNDFKSILDILMISFGMLIGGLSALAAVWLWFDYQIDPANSLLTLLSVRLAAVLPGQIQSYLSSQTQLMGLPLTGKTSAYWYMARAGGIVSYVLIWFSVVWGLVLSTKITGKLIPAPITYGLHEFLSILAVVFAVLHAVVLLGDEYIKFNVFHLIVPFTAPYEPLWTGLGVIGLYLTAALTLSFYFRKQLGQKVWRSLHYLTFAAFVLTSVHGMMAGSDSGLIVTTLLYWGTGFSVVFLTYYRLLTLKVKEKKPARR